MSAPVVETVAQFGPDRSLVGILTACGPRSAADPPAIVMPNTGILPRVGPHRMFVALARAFGSMRHAVLRFDLAGLGDSRDRVGTTDPIQGGNADLKAALDWLETGGRSQVILFGLCSGADRSVIYAGLDPRVVGLVLVDPSIPPTPRFRSIALRRRIAKTLSVSGLSGLPNLLRGMARRRLGREIAAQRVAQSVDWLRRSDVRAFLQGAYAQTVAAGIPILAIFTDDVQRQHNYKEQLRDAFPGIDFGDRLTIHYLQGPDHLFTREADRALLFGLVRDWLACFAKAG